MNYKLTIYHFLNGKVVEIQHSEQLDGKWKWGKNVVNLQQNEDYTCSEF